MATPPREVILKALFETVNKATFAIPILGHTTFVTSQRKLTVESQMPIDVQPSLHQFEGVAEKYEWQGIKGQVRILGVSLFCWFRVPSGDSSELGSTYINYMLEAIEQTLIADTPEKMECTLGGLVYWCRIEGKVIKVPGDLDPQGLLVVPIRMEIP